MCFSLYYFGPIPYYQKLAEQKEVVLDVHEPFRKQTWRSRAEILGANGKLLLSVPVIRPDGKDTQMKDILIAEAEDWRKDHWKAIESAYRHAPYFFFYGEQIKSLIYDDYQRLSQLNLSIFEKVNNWLDLDLNYRVTENTIKEKSEIDFMKAFERKKLNQDQKSYIQVFSDKLPFFSNLSILDLIMNLGPLARNYLTKTI